jgi:tetratricopeptide (TPR) repeat protein
MASFIQTIKGLRLWPYAIIGLTVTLSYLPTFTGGFLLDDHRLIRNNPHITESRPLTSYFAQEDGIVERENTDNEHTGYYRPLTTLTYKLDYKIWGMRPQGLRTTNVLLHILTCLVLCKLILFLVNDRQAAFWATLLYAIHPVNTESVSWVCARNNILVTLLFLVAFYVYVKGQERAWPLYGVISAMFFAMALLSKELGLLVFPCIFLYQRLLVKNSRPIRHEVVTYVPFLLIGTGYFLLRKMVIGSWLTPPGEMPLWERLFFVSYLMAWDFRLIFVPHRLHNFIVNYPSSYLNWHVLASFLVICLLGIVIWKARKDRFLIFCVLSFCVTLLPTLNIIPIPSVSLISMRWLYLPMVFVFLAAARLVGKFLKTNYTLATSVLSLLFLYLGLHSYVLNSALWHDEDTFLRQEVVGFNNAFHAGELAETLLNKKDYLSAERYFQIAIDKYPKVGKNYINYSALLLYTARPELAISVLSEAESLFMTRKERGEWYNNTGTAYFQLKKYEEALEYHKQSVQAWPFEPQFWSNLGASYGSVGDFDNSISVLEKGLRKTPGSSQIRKNLAVAHYRLGHYAEAISVLKKIPSDKWEELDINAWLHKSQEALASASCKGDIT